eukprot:156410-Chlamydomonas_euryale.AAC.8
MRPGRELGRELRWPLGVAAPSAVACQPAACPAVVRAAVAWPPYKALCWRMRAGLGDAAPPSAMASSDRPKPTDGKRLGVLGLEADAAAAGQHGELRSVFRRPPRADASSAASSVLAPPASRSPPVPPPSAAAAAEIPPASDTLRRRDDAAAVPRPLSPPPLPPRAAGCACVGRQDSPLSGG